MKVLINDVWREIETDAGDEVTFNQVIKASGLPMSHNHAYRIAYSNAVGVGGELVSGILQEGRRIKIRDEITSFVVTDSNRT